MKAFLYGIALQGRLDIRSKTLLITCYLVPLLFFVVMGGIFTSIMPGTEATLIPAMTVFGVTMGALIGLPPTLVEIYGTDIRKVYQANGVPLVLGLVLCNISAFVHLFIMSLILYFAAPLLFQAEFPIQTGAYFGCLAIFIAVSLSIASVIGLAVRDQAKTSMVSILFFLPSILLSGIMFPAELLPKGFAAAGRFFPASWGYPLMSGAVFQAELLIPLLARFLTAGLICAALLKRISRK